MPKDAEIHKLCAKADYDGVEAMFRPSSTQIDVNIPGSGGRTPLHRAIGANANDIVKSLIEKHNADVNKTDNTGRTAIHFSVISSNADILEYLLEKDTSTINQLTDKKSSALHLAVNSSAHACLEVLLNKFDPDNNRIIDMEIKNNNNVTAYEIACEKKDSQTISIFRKYKAAGAAKSGACIIL